MVQGRKDLKGNHLTYSFFLVREIEMTLCNICLGDKETEKLDRLDICSLCMEDVKYKVKEYEKEAGKKKK